MPFLRSLPRHFPPHTVALMRVDFNVPLDDHGHILDTSRITNHLATLRFLKKHDCKIILLAHLGKPGGKYVGALSFGPLLAQIELLLQEKIVLQTLESIYPTADISLLDNIRFYSGEEENDAAFSQKLASLGTLYVNDAFSVSHRSHASTVGITQYLPSYAGFALQQEYNNLHSIFHNPESPITLVIGGKKVSDKIGVLEHLLPRVDHVLIGGACANVFYQAIGRDIQQSYSEMRMIPDCKMLWQQFGNKFILPIDFQIKNGMFLDIGEKTVRLFQATIESSHTVIWAGPMGKYEEAPFEQGSVALLSSVTKAGIISIIGGGDTIAALQAHPELHKVSFVSLGGGAMLDFLAKEHLPGTDCLLQS